MSYITTPKDWATDFIRHNCTLAQVKRELEACNANPKMREDVINEFYRQTIENMEVAKRGRDQFRAWSK
tara:strand:- start:382 stop:588 length:207 start_codon:yes stop_codon:yes gene_type:complete